MPRQLDQTRKEKTQTQFIRLESRTTIKRQHTLSHDHGRLDTLRKNTRRLECMSKRNGIGQQVQREALENVTNSIPQTISTYTKDQQGRTDQRIQNRSGN